MGQFVYLGVSNKTRRVVGDKKLFYLTDAAVLLLIGIDIVKGKLERETIRPSFPVNRRRPMLHALKRTRPSKMDVACSM